jgi:beta-lactamase class A
MFDKSDTDDRLALSVKSFRRRSLLLAAAMHLSLAACARRAGGDRSAATSTPGPAISGRFAALERKYHARLGAYALAIRTGTTIAYRADERFAFCSTFKAPLVAAVLARNPLTHLNTLVTYTSDAIRSISPVTRQHIQTGMTIGQLCDAAVRYSDGTAANLLLDDIGGPTEFTAYLRSLGDAVSRLDQAEPELNRDAPGDPRDTTTPRAIGAIYQRLVLGDALTSDKRAILTDWMARTTTGARRIRAGFPPDWKVADKTGTGDFGRANDIAVAWSPSAVPHVVAVMSDRAGGYHAEPSDALIAEAATVIASAMT